MKHPLFLAAALMCLAPPALASAAGLGLPDEMVLTLHGPAGDDVVVWNRMSGRMTPVAPSPFNESHATWSPDGKWLAFQTDRDGNWETYVARTQCPGPDAECVFNVTKHPGCDMYPNWSSDGRVVHMSDRSGNPEIWLSSPRGGPSVNLTNHPGPDWHPNMSPFGGVLALRSDRGANPEIWRVDLRTGRADNLTRAAGTDRYPVYSPDGGRILFVSNRTGNQDVWVMDARGRNPTRLTFHPARDYQASWSPDGRSVLFVSDRAGRGDLYLLDPETGAVDLLLDAEQPVDWPFWAPAAVGGRR